jgi:hypothetical protein
MVPILLVEDTGDFAGWNRPKRGPEASGGRRQLNPNLGQLTMVVLDFGEIISEKPIFFVRGKFFFLTVLKMFSYSFGR